MRRLQIGASVVGLGAFALLSVAVQSQWLFAVDLWAARAAQAIVGQAADVLANAAALIFAFELVCIGSAVAALVLLRRGAGFWSLTPLGFVPLTALEVMLKLSLTTSPLPSELQRAYDFPLLHPLFPNSYPSGHAMRLTFVCLLVALLASRTRPTIARVLILGSALATIVVFAPSRVYLGVHWLTDVLGGVILGATAACLLAPGLADRLRRSAQ